MRIVTHQSKDAPPKHAWIAAFYVPAGMAEERLPMVFFGRTKDIAVAKAEAWLSAERATEDAKNLAAAERAKQRRTDA